MKKLFTLLFVAAVTTYQIAIAKEDHEDIFYSFFFGFRSLSRLEVFSFLPASPIAQFLFFVHFNVLNCGNIHLRRTRMSPIPSWRCRE